jgi:hypothetical protein
MIIKCIIVLPFLKPNDMQQIFKRLAEKIRTHETNAGCERFLQYIEGVYIGDGVKLSIFKLEDISLFDRVISLQPLTTNCSEGWHRALNYDLNESHPNFRKLCKYIVTNNCIVEHEISCYLEKVLTNNLEYEICKKMQNLKKLAESYESLEKVVFLEFLVRIYCLKVEE